MSKILLSSADNQTIQVNANAIGLSMVLGGLLEDIGYDQISQEAIPLGDFEIDYETMNKTVEYMEHHAANPADYPKLLKPVFKDISDQLGEFDKSFLKGLSDELLFKVIKASHKLSIAKLEELTMSHLAAIINTSSHSDVSKRFQLSSN